MKSRLIEQVMLYDYRYVLGFGTLFIVSAFALFWKLERMLPGLGAYEASYVISTQSFNEIIKFPLFWPHKLLSLASANIFGPSELALRLPSVLIAIIGLLAFFGFIRSRFRARIAIIAVGLIATSSWWLSYARLARPEIMLPVCVFLLLYCCQRAYEDQQSKIWLLLSSVVIGLSLFVPFMPYILIIGAWISRSKLTQYRDIIGSAWYATGLLIIGTFGICLLASVITNLDVGRELLGLPSAWPSPIELIQNISNGIAELFWQASSVFWPLRLGTLPLLDLFTAVMLVLGFYHLDREVSRSLAYFTLVGLGLLMVLTQLATLPWHNAILLPFVYILIAAGIVMLFSQWYEIFPRNPVARMIAFVPTIILLAVVVFYHQQRFFIAWPNSPEIMGAYPPLSLQLRSVLDTYPTTIKVVTVVTENEVGIAKVQSYQKNNVEITTVGTSALFHSNVVISADAFNRLDKADQKRLSARLMPMTTTYQTQPVSLYYSAL